jgi:flagellar protein FliS
MIGANRYKTTQNETASPQRLMVLLFEAALKNARSGAQALEQGRRVEAVAPLTKASDIVAELEATLDPQHAPELCKSLSDVYRFVATRLTRAALTGSAQAAREAERAFAPLVDAFRQAVAAAGAR